MSISNVDLTDTEQNSLDEAFGKMHEKVNSLFFCIFLFRKLSTLSFSQKIIFLFVMK